MSNLEDAKAGDALAIGTSDHDKVMISKDENGDIVTETEKETARKEEEAKLAKTNLGENVPDWIPEKYKNAEDPLKAFLEGHKELEAKLGSPELDTKTEKDKTTDESVDEVSEEETEKAIERGDLSSFYQEFVDTGEISEDSYEKLEKMGFGQELVDTYITGYVAKVEKITKEAHEIVGGEGEYTAMVKWAKDNMTDLELTAYNDQLGKGKETWELALRGLHNKYTSSGNKPIQRIRSGQKPLEEGLKPFLSQHEVTTAMKDKRYKTDPAYRKAIADKLMISDNDLMGVNIIAPKQFAQLG